MKRFIITIYTLVFSCFVNIGFSQSNKDVKITSTGSGKTIEEAKQAALRSATEQAFGAFISSRTEMFNDLVMADQMASVSNGNIKSFEILNQDQLPDGRWGLTLQAIVSVDKLTSFVQAKGVAIEVKGGILALNIKQQLLNEESEVLAVADLVGLIHEFMQISFDYTIQNGEPQSVDNTSKSWEIPLTISAFYNKNIDACANYFIKTLKELSLKKNEIETYKTLNKEVFPFHVKYKGDDYIFYFRSQNSIKTIASFEDDFPHYKYLFKVQCGEEEMKPIIEEQESQGKSRSLMVLVFPSENDQAGVFKFYDTKSLEQLEEIEGYSVKPKGVVSYYIYNGILIPKTINGKQQMKLEFEKVYVSEYHSFEYKLYNKWGQEIISESSSNFDTVSHILSTYARDGKLKDNLYVYRLTLISPFRKSKIISGELNLIY